MGTGVVGTPAAPAIGGVTVEGALRSAGLGPVLDTPVAAVLRTLGLPPLPSVPPLPPLPGLPPLPVLDLSALFKPLTDLLGAFGTGDLAGAGDPTKIFNGLSSLLDLTVSGTTSALKAVDKVWAGTAATSAAAKMGRTATETGLVSQQGAGMSVDITAGAAIVAGGLTALQGVIAKAVGLVSATLPVIWTPPGQAAALAAISAGITEGTAVITATKAQLLAPTARMAVNGAPVPISGAPAGAASPFALAATALEALAVPLKSATGILGSTLAAAARNQAAAKKVDTGKKGSPAGDRDRCRTDDQGTGASALAGGARLAGAGRGGAGAATGAAGAREVTARYTARTPVPGGTEPAAMVGTTGSAPIPATAAGSGAAIAPMAGAGALGGAHAVGRVMGGPPLVRKSDEALADCDQICAPAVFGADGDPAPPGPEDTADGSALSAEARLAALREELLA